MVKFILILGLLLPNGKYEDKSKTYDTFAECHSEQLRLVQDNRELILDEGRLVVVCVTK